VADEDEIGPTRRVKRLVPAQSQPSEGAKKAAPAPRETSAYEREIREARKACLDAGGEAFGGFVLLGDIGKGGMSEVRLAVEIAEIGALRLCVIKRAKPGAEATLLDEGRLLRRLLHRNVVELYATGTIDGRAFLSFELIDGLSLRQIERLLLDEPLPLAPVLEIGARAAEGLAYVHGARDGQGTRLHVVHRDISPENVLVSREGVVKLVDFGIARYADRSAMTQLGYIKGKLGYLAPEQIALDVGPIGPSTDVFALGLVIAELVAWQRLLPAKMLIAADMPELLRERCGSAPPALIELLTAMTATDPAVRPSAESVAHALDGMRAAIDPPGPTIATLAKDRLFAKLLPIDLATVLELPTKRVQKLDTPKDDAEIEAPYSATMEALARVRRKA
jgi:serine/threonine-protein kinase